jgi:phosphoribosyl 1,2-cyclic phosphate phosphodiesterase
LKLTFLGTGTSQGVPVIGCKCDVCVSKDNKDKRLRTSAMVEINDCVLVIDTGPDFRQQMLRENVEHLTAILYTHEHKDHIAGMDDIRAFNYIHQKPVDLYASSQVEEALKREFHYVFSGEQYPGIPQINLHHIDNENFKIQDVCIEPIALLHYKLPVLGFKIHDLVYITDANYISDTEKEKIKNCKVLVLNALRIEQHISHFTLNEALELVKELKPEKAYFTHISHQLGLHKEVQKILPDNVFLAYDELQVSF